MEIRVLSSLDLSESGILVNNRGQSVHIAQGDIDGACGPYCAIMAMTALGRFDPQKLLAVDKIDYRTSAGRLLRAINESSDTLLRAGTTLQNLCDFIYTNRVFGYDSQEGDGRELVPKARQAILNDKAVILDVVGRSSDNLNHWVVAVATSEKYLFLLDPSYELPRFSFWNSILTVLPSGSTYPHRYTTPVGSYKVKVGSMISVF